MKLYRTTAGIVIENDIAFYKVPTENWDELINDDQLFTKLRAYTQTLPVAEAMNEPLIAPIGQQEIWACGVTYLRSKIGRQEESKDAGGGDFYARVYHAKRPEVFFKCTPHRVVNPYGKVRLRKDSNWNVPEPELTLVVTSSGKIIGYTIGNDMSSRDIEGENPLYLPQAKTYDGCAAIGPCILIREQPIKPDTNISLTIIRQAETAFSSTISLNQMKRTLPELVSFVFAECSFPAGCYIMTGTGIVPPNDFTLLSGDEIRIAIEGIGELVNTVE